MDTIKTTEEALRNGELSNNPHGCAEAKAKLSGEFSFLMGQLEEILSHKPAQWNVIRLKHKSDKACDKVWEATPEGINEMGLRLRVKRIGVLISALNTLIRMAELEAKNI